MIILFIIGLLVFTIKLIVFVCKAAYGIVKSIFCILGLPLVLIILFAAGLSYVALPLLVVGIVVVFAVSILKKI